MSSTIPLQQGVLIATDEQSVVFLCWYNERIPESRRFLVLKLDSRSVFVRRDRLPLVYAALEQRLKSTVWDEDLEDAARLAKEVGGAAAAAGGGGGDA
jgi:hypothetical protein